MRSLEKVKKEDKFKVLPAETSAKVLVAKSWKSEPMKRKWEKENKVVNDSNHPFGQGEEKPLIEGELDQTNGREKRNSAIVETGPSNSIDRKLRFFFFC